MTGKNRMRWVLEEMKNLRINVLCRDYIILKKNKRTNAISDIFAKFAIIGN